MVELEEPLATLWRGKDAFAEVKTEWRGLP